MLRIAGWRNIGAQKKEIPSALWPDRSAAAVRGLGLRHRRAMTGKESAMAEEI